MEQEKFPFRWPELLCFNDNDPFVSDGRLNVSIPLAGIAVFQRTYYYGSASYPPFCFHSVGRNCCVSTRAVEQAAKKEGMDVSIPLAGIAVFQRDDGLLSE